MTTSGDTLSSVLQQMQAALAELALVLKEEVAQLNRSQINPVSLQLLTDSKSQLLATLQHYDDCRRACEQADGVAAPYTSDSALAAQWRKVLEQVHGNNQHNQRVHQLLEMHRNKTQQLNQLVQQAGADQRLYGAAGSAPPEGRGRVFSSRA